MYNKMLILCSLVFCLMLGGCTNNDSPRGLNYDVAGLPAWEDFSDTDFESYISIFSGVKSVTYKYNDTKKGIATNDFRVIRLLNFLAYSYENMLSTWEHGHVSQERVDAYLATDVPMLEIIFQIDETLDPDAYKDLQKIVICGDSVLCFLETRADVEGVNDRVYVERYWPYGELIMRDIMSDSAGHLERKDLLSYEGWGSGYWIDLPEYAGFFPN